MLASWWSCRVAVEQDYWIEITCQQCGIIRKVRRCYTRRRKNHYCSEECFYASRRKQEPMEYDGDLFFLHRDGYYVSKRTRRALHRVIYEKHYGPIPTGYKLYFRDKNKNNLSVENLYLKEMNPKGGCDECGKKIWARGKCNTHYGKMRAREKAATSGKNQVNR